MMKVWEKCPFDNITTETAIDCQVRKQIKGWSKGQSLGEVFLRLPLTERDNTFGH